jgi:hypothetical protein
MGKGRKFLSAPATIPIESPRIAVSTFKHCAISAAAGLIIGGVSVYLFTLKEARSGGVKSIAVSPVWGGPINHSGWTYTPGKVSFTTTADAPGEIRTDIPAAMIPEARYWMTKVNSVSVIAGYDLARETTITAVYMRRFGVFSVGGGLSARIGERIESGIVLSASYWFE